MQIIVPAVIPVHRIPDRLHCFSIGVRSSPAGKTIHNRVPHELFTLVPVVLSTIVAIMLTVIAFFSLDDSAVLICQRIVPPGVPIDLTGFINALLLTITIIVLFETVTGYFKTKHAEVR
ncbi:MAG: hypothetical protein WCB46_04620 [Methanoregula sp.]